MDTNYQIISVFTHKELGYRGNPAAVMLLDQLPSEAKMQQIARELEQPATSFLSKAEGEGHFHIRWFAPDAEIGLCGHGTAAATAFLANRFPERNTFDFAYRDGNLSGTLNPDQTVSISTRAISLGEQLEEIPQAILDGLNVPVLAMYRTANKHLILVEKEEDIRHMKPDFERLKESDIFGYAVTAKGKEADFVSRTFVPHTEAKEDHATGSSHAILVPFWAEKLNKSHFLALQLSERGGAFHCELADGMVNLSGEYQLDLNGKTSI